MSSSKHGFTDINTFGIEELANLVSLPIHIITPDGKVKMVNDAWCQTYGKKREDVLGLYIHDAIFLNNSFYVELGDDIKSDFMDSE